MHDKTKPTARGTIFPARHAHRAARHRRGYGAAAARGGHACLFVFLLAGCAPNRLADPPVQADVPAVAPTVAITEEDVAEQKAANAQRRLERSIRRDFERTQNWSDSDD